MDKCRNVDTSEKRGKIHGLCAICGAKVHKKFYFGKKSAEICAIIIIFARK